MDGISFLSYTNGEAIPLSSIEFGGIMDTGNFAQAGETDTDDLFSQFLDVERWPLSVAIPHCTIPVAHCFEANASGTEGLIRPAELHASSVNERLEELRRHEQQQHLQLQFQGNPQAQGGLLSHNCCGATRGMIQQHHLQKQQRLSEPEQLSHLQQGLLQQVQYTPFHQLQTGELDSHMQVEKQLTVIPSPLDMAIVAMETDQEQYIQSYPQLLPNATLAERFQQPSYILYSSPATSSTSPTCFSPMSSPEMSSPMIEQGRLASEDNMCHSPVPNILAPMVALTGQIHAAAIVRNPTLSSPVSRMQVESIESSFQQASMSVIVTSSRASQQGQQQRHDAYLSDSDDSEAMFKKTKRRHVRRPKITSKGQSKPSVKLQCSFPGCTVTCASTPSLERHTQTHRWRGIYAPVRCEACQSALSNEFSVQRHIMRSQETSRCRRMRVYSIMKSLTEVETTVRFYPKRSHGRKTKVVDLELIRSRFFPSAATN